MNVTIMRQVKFCAGHRLVGHEGKCANLHGHNYLAQFYVTGGEFDEVGRVVDFSVINRLFKGWIDENWDEEVGDCRQEIVFIGVNMDRQRIEAVLDDALVTKEEMAAGTPLWLQFPDPLPSWEAPV